MSDYPDIDDDMARLLGELHSLLSELWEPAGVLIYYGSPNKIIGGRRPCDSAREHRYDDIRELIDRLDALCSGAFA